MKLRYFAAIYNFIQVRRPTKRQHFGINVSPYEISESPLFGWPGQPLLIWAAGVPKSHGDSLAAELPVHLPWRTESNPVLTCLLYLEITAFRELCRSPGTQLAETSQRCGNTSGQSPLEGWQEMGAQCGNSHSPDKCWISLMPRLPSPAGKEVTVLIILPCKDQWLVSHAIKGSG